MRDSEISKFDIDLVLERLLEKGKIIVKKAYADWERYSDYKRPFHEAAIELIDIPQKYYSGKNSADIKMVVDAMDLSYSKEHLDTFVILSGDSDFSPLVSKLKENNKYVIGVGVKNSSSNLLIDNCDEFIYYEDVWRDAQKGPKLDGLNKKTAEAFSLMIDAIQALLRENKDVLWGSMIKQTMQRKKPSFNEGYYGYSTFSELLEDAERKSIIKLKKDQRSGTYIVTGFATGKEAGERAAGRPRPRPLSQPHARTPGRGEGRIRPRRYSWPVSGRCACRGGEAGCEKPPYLGIPPISRSPLSRGSGRAAGRGAGGEGSTQSGRRHALSPTRSRPSASRRSARRSRNWCWPFTTARFRKSSPGRAPLFDHDAQRLGPGRGLQARTRAKGTRVGRKVWSG